MLSTHEHVDHLDLPFLREFCAVNARAPIVVPAPVMTIAAGAGIDPEPPDRRGSRAGPEGRRRHRAPGPGAARDRRRPARGDSLRPGGGPVRFLGYLVDIGGIRFYHAGDGLAYPELPATLSALAPDVLMLPINGRDHMRESAGIVGNMNETEAAWLCAQVEASYVIPMHYDAIRDNTGDPGHFADLVRQGGSAAAVIMPARGLACHSDAALAGFRAALTCVRPGPMV